MSEDNFRILIESISKQRSTKNLSKFQLEKLALAIYRLHPELKQKRSGQRTPNKYKSIPKNVSNLQSILTPDQNELIKNLVTAVNFSSEYKNLTDDSLPLNMFKKTLKELSRHEAQSVTEALKKMLIRSNQEQFDKFLKSGFSRTDSIFKTLRLILVKGMGV
ncbi:PF06252 family protein [Leptospira santarosai str. JET]|nr:PF06252 family protein [Leptospira santarosai str. JET]